jgi:four helix bundle protein
MRPHEKLDVYQMAHRLAVDVHRLSLMLPRFEVYEQASQVRRSSKSVSAQIVEGHALRNYRNDYLRYLNRAYASGEETIEHIRFLLETESGSKHFSEWNQLATEYDSLCRKIYNYTTVVARRPPSTRYPDIPGDLPAPNP